MTSGTENVNKNIEEYTKKILLAFDFDHTVIDANSDTAIYKLFKGGKPPGLEDLYKNNGWTIYMQEIFKILHSEGCMEEDYLSCLKDLSFTPCMLEFLLQIDKKRVDCLIISDSNSIFINSILEHNKCAHVFDRIFTNEAYFDEDGLLNIRMFHKQDWCNLSEINMCKGEILTNFVNAKSSEGTEYSFIGYIGDGKNDFCPGLCLQQTDVLFARQGYSLVKQIELKKAIGKEITSKVIHWSDANEISLQIQKWISCEKLEIIPKPRLLPVNGK